LSILYPCSIRDGLTCFTNFTQLTDLRLHYSLGEFISAQLLLDIARSCLHLDTISLNDGFCRSIASQSQPIDIQSVQELFGAGEELFDYFEPLHTKRSDPSRSTLSGYAIHVDRLRRDRLSSQ
jgi:hypothetical protein